MRATLRAARMINRRRRSVAVVLAAAAAACAGLAIQPVPVTEILAAARDLRGGPLVASDVTVVRLPENAVPDGTLRAGTRVTGRVLAAPVRRGEPITDLRLLGPALVDAYGPGMVATPVRITDAGSARLVRPGDVIDVIAAAAQWDDALDLRTALVAQAVTIIALPHVTDSSGSMAEHGALVVLATTPEQATHLAQAASGSRLSITIHGRSH